MLQALTWPLRQQRYFSETIKNVDLTGTLGSFTWSCDFPAGAALGIEIHNGNGSIYDVGYQHVQPGSTDACLWQNLGQLATASMAALASSLSSASPELFTYTSTSTSTSSTSTSTLSSTITSSPTSSTTSPSATLLPASPISSGTNLGLVIGCTIGGVALLAAGALLLYFALRRRRPGATSDGSQEKGPTTGGAPSAAEAGGAGGILGALSSRRRSASFSNPIQAWRGRITAGRPPSGYSAASPVDVDAPRFGSLGMGMSATGGSLSAGPRVGVPEVYDGGDHAGVGGVGAYGGVGAGFGAASAQRGVGSTSSGAYDPLPSPSEFVLPNALRYPPTLPPHGYLHPVPEAEAYEPPFASLDQRPPTRLTTPGGGSSWNGGGSAESARDLPYQSYTRE
ncbi:hypothetical protein BCR35DRAFT_309479 [Leucosporidium creatinivorum]|uniref:Mid2 domain-containing protein n=1 Tax=Leucosporidium creatinivorum TaxID=106004 RepID=A0A1Y2DGF1_9BASI|nr:hypothetical protein BCR35DRAFT_309479 [Leucosporidium creatinivorum]